MKRASREILPSFFIDGWFSRVRSEPAALDSGDGRRFGRCIELDTFTMWSGTRSSKDRN